MQTDAQHQHLIQEVPILLLLHQVQDAPERDGRRRGQFFGTGPAVNQIRKGLVKPLCPPDLFDLFLGDGVIDFTDEGDLLLAFARTLGASRAFQ